MAGLDRRLGRVARRWTRVEQSEPNGAHPGYIPDVFGLRPARRVLSGGAWQICHRIGRSSRGGHRQFRREMGLSARGAQRFYFRHHR